MTEIDLWADEELTTESSLPSPETSSYTQTNTLLPEVYGKQVVLTLDEQDIHLFSQQDLSGELFVNLLGSRLVESSDGTNHYAMRMGPLNAYVLRQALRNYKTIIDSTDAKILASAADTIPVPRAELSEDGKHVNITIPNIKVYRDLVRKVHGYPVKNGYRIDIARVLDLEAMSETMESPFPKIQFDRQVLQLNREPIVGFDGTLQSLKTIPVSALNIVSANHQSWKALKTSKQTLGEKLSSLGIDSLYDLLFSLPKRYIDKSQPQDFKDLIEGETAVVVGTLEEVGEITSGCGGAVFKVKTNTGHTIRSTFFNQKWLTNKFKIGNNVLVTGKFSWWNHTPQISGSSIEHADEATVLPIVPVYKQSPSKGVTTYFIMSANRELLSRLGNIKLPAYLRQEGRMNYCEALTELHFPSSMQRHREALDTLAFYELVHMQILIQDAKTKNAGRPGLSMLEGEQKLQARGIKALPFQLTKDQKRATVTMNRFLASSHASMTLLNADVGAGKSVIAQLAALRAVDAGYQAVIVAPTEVLATQLHHGFEKLLNAMGREARNITLDFVKSKMKTKDKRAMMARIASGETNIIVGTPTAMTSIEYYNLGFVAIDEQQKFGAQQRSRMLSARVDGSIPHIMMQTATPIPRSTAQVFYGDVDMIELREKPPGRLPIVTKWVQEDSLSVLEQATNEIWTDVINEAHNGNQTFIIAPLVSESDKIDAASVERTFKNLSSLSLSGLRIGLVHGQMKSEQQQAVMAAFRDHDYDVLVSSLVVEVGVDIPDATRVVVLSAERLGSASLHQIRGRVGRSNKPSICYLVSLGSTEAAQSRLQALVDNEDGFAIAKADLSTRGEGKLFSVEQSGRSEMIFASLAKHADRINEAKETAKAILKSPFREQALRDSRDKFEAEERMI
jgi:ATP-dependent DNA helicase RecG